jgi:hypothetical protein
VFVILLLAGVAILACVVLVALGRAGEMATFPGDGHPLDLDEVTAADVMLLRPPMALWGYQVQATEEALQVIARSVTARDSEIAALHRELDSLRGPSAAEPPERPVKAVSHWPEPGATLEPGWAQPEVGATEPAWPEPAEPAWPEPAEPAWPEPAEPERPEAGTGATELAWGEPDATGPGWPEPGATTTEPGWPEPGATTTEPGWREPGATTTEPGWREPGATTTEPGWLEAGSDGAGSGADE